MIEFKKALQARLLSLANTYVGQPSGLKPHVVTFDDHLSAYQQTQLPAIVVYITQNALDQVEIAPYGDHVWNAVMYYLDTTTPGEQWSGGEQRRDTIIGTLQKQFEKNHFLADTTGPLKAMDIDGATETVYSSQIPTITFDGSGQEEYYTFVSEVYFEVHTSKNR